jgi:DNA-directed RNA polymerase specialized sigma24 family protein
VDALTCEHLVDGCLRRVSRWKLPPNWSRRDWFEEARAQGTLAACQAELNWDSSRGTQFDSFVQHRVVGSILARYRQEWRFALRSRLAAPLSSRASDDTGTSDAEAAADALEGVLQQLSKEDLQLLLRLFWDHSTERQIARDIGVSQPAISKRKKVLLRELRLRLETPRRGPNQTQRFFSPDSVPRLYPTHLPAIDLDVAHT